MAEKSQSTASKKGLPKSYYVSAHLLKATKLLNKVMAQKGKKWVRFGVHSLELLSEEDLHLIDSKVKVLSIRSKASDGKWHPCLKSKLFDLSAYEPISSNLKRRALTRKGSERYLDACFCFWFSKMEALIPFDKREGKNGPFRSLHLSDSQSPIDHSIWFTVDGTKYHILLCGNGQAYRKHQKRKVGQTKGAEVEKAAEAQCPATVDQGSLERKIARQVAMVQGMAATVDSVSDESVTPSGLQY